MKRYAINFGFTLAEVLITLGVIGVVAAMTMPTVIKNYQKKVTVERLKVAYSTLYQALKMSQIENGNADEWEYPGDSSPYADQKNFTQKYFLPYMKNVKICENRTDCWAEKFFYLDNTEVVPNNNSHPCYLVLNNGSVMRILSHMEYHITAISIDLNGKKEPNTYGKDIFPLLVRFRADGFESYWGPNQKVGELYFEGQNLSIEKLRHTGNYPCSKTEGTNRGIYCGALIMQNNWQMPDDYPW